MLESEQKIRILKLMQHHIDLRELRRIDDQNPAEHAKAFQWLDNLFLQINVLVFETIESDILNGFSISGYIARSVTHSNKCSSCMTLLLSHSDFQEDIFFDFDTQNYQSLFVEANRGGLCAPTNFCFTYRVVGFHSF